MKVEKVHSGIRYTLSNEDLKVGDEVFPIAYGRCLNNDEWIFHNLDFRNFMSGFPEEPHTIVDLDYASVKRGKPYQVKTNRGYAPIEGYYKIIKMEKQIKVGENRFGSTYDWIEIENLNQKQT